LVRLITPSHIVELDLNKHPEDLRSEMAGKWRNRLVGAENAKLSLQSIKMPTDANHWLWARDAEHQRLKSFRALPHDLTRAYLHVSPNAGRLFTVLENGIPRAAMLFLRHGSTASYHIGWNSDRGRALNAHNLLLWRAMIALRDQGIERLDLGSIDTEASPGLARFKLGSGAKPRALGGSWLYSRATAALSRRSPNLIHPEHGLLN
jgi:lipid II:glycine glycyltransferase (peptidoglycan interpeptide bridge formation enzyme)